MAWFKSRASLRTPYPPGVHYMANNHYMANSKGWFGQVVPFYVNHSTPCH